MAGRDVCIWKASACESIHLYYARALAYLPRCRVPSSTSSRELGNIFDFRSTKGRPRARRVKQYAKFSRFATRWPLICDVTRPFLRFLIFSSPGSAKFALEKVRRIDDAVKIKWFFFLFLRYRVPLFYRLSR